MVMAVKSDSGSIKGWRPLGGAIEFGESAEEALAREFLEEIGQPMDIAVVDAGGNLKAHVRMDGAFVGSITISINKAYTAIAFQQETAHLQEDTRPGGPIFGLSDAHGGRLVVFPGGIPLVREGEIVGAIGVSTGTVEQDQEVAEAGVAAF